MSEIKVTPFAFGGNSGDAVYAYIDNNTRLNQDQKNEIERRVNSHDMLVKLATKHATRADELYEALEQARDFIANDKNAGPYGLGMICIIDNVLDKSRIEAESKQ